MNLKLKPCQCIELFCPKLYHNNIKISQKVCELFYQQINSLNHAEITKFSEFLSLIP